MLVHNHKYFTSDNCIFQDLVKLYYISYSLVPNHEMTEVTQVIPIKLGDVVDLPTEPCHPQCIQQLAVQCKAHRCYKSQPDNWKVKVKKFFYSSCGKICAMHLYALPSAVAVLV